MDPTHWLIYNANIAESWSESMEFWFPCLGILAQALLKTKAYWSSPCFLHPCVAIFLGFGQIHGVGVHSFDSYIGEKKNLTEGCCYFSRKGIAVLNKATLRGKMVCGFPSSRDPEGLSSPHVILSTLFSCSHWNLQEIPNGVTPQFGQPWSSLTSSAEWELKKAGEGKALPSTSWLHCWTLSAM